MTLYTEQTGTGPDLVLIHGWGAHGGIWSELVTKLQDNFRLTIIDLPGSGRSPPMDKEFTLENIIAEIKRVTPESAIWLGWSLGALIVLALAASDKDRVKKMILAGGSPCFTKKQDWNMATDENVLRDFGEMLKKNHRKTLVRFLSLQMGDSSRTRQVLRTQRELLFQYGDPDIATLEEMLEVLIQTDLRDSLSQIDQPALLIHGSRDILAPLATARYLQENLFAAELFTIEGDGHIPFLTHTELCAQKINEFCLSI